MISKRQLDTSVRHAPRHLLQSLVTIAAIAMGSAETATAGTLFGNVTADLFAPAVSLASVLDGDANDPNEASIARVPRSEKGSGAKPTVPVDPQLQSRTPSRAQLQRAQTSQQPRIDTRINLSDLRNRSCRRPRAVLPLYATFAALQILDAHSTTRALKNGGIEANPVISSFAGNTGALYATKLATTAATIYAVEKLWPKNRVAAILTMVAINSAYTFVVRHNYGVAGR
jgi:hypothetical protein